MFNLRGASSGTGFSGRVDDVFSALGSGSVKTPTDYKDINKPDFDRQQLERNIKPDRQNFKRQWNKDSDYRAPTPPSPSRDKVANKSKDGSGFKHPAEFLKPDRRRESSPNGGGRGRGGRFRGGRGGQMPDFKKNPGKWTKYSLADVDTMTNQQNTSAALQFLKSIKDREKEEPKADLNVKPVFNRPSRTKRNDRKETADTAMETDKFNTDADAAAATTTDKPTFVGAKQILPEYVVGAKPAKKPGKAITKTVKPAKAGKEMKLSHLGDDDEEDE